MIYCPTCGTENEDDAKFCKSCGRLLDDVKDVKAATNPQPAGSRSDDEGVPLGADGQPAAQAVDPLSGPERSLWKGRPSFIFSPIRSVTNRYEVTSERLKVDKGFISRHRQEIDLYRVDDVEVKQGLVQRMADLGNINLFSSDSSTPIYTLYDVPHPEQVKDMIRSGSRAERARRRVILREDV